MVPVAKALRKKLRHNHLSQGPGPKGKRPLGLKQLDIVHKEISLIYNFDI